MPTASMRAAAVSYVTIASTLPCISAVPATPESPTAMKLMSEAFMQSSPYMVCTV